MKPVTWFDNARNYFQAPEENEEREKRLNIVKENMAKLLSGDFEGCEVEELMHELAYLRMEKELFEAGQMIIDHWPWENKEFAIGEFAYQFFGIFCYLERRYKESEQWFLKILGDHEGYNTTFYRWLACIYAEMGHHNKAIEMIEAVKNHASASSIAYYAYDFGKYFHSIGMYEEALVEFNNYQGDTNIMEYEFYISKSDCLRHLGRYDEAREFLETGYKFWTRDPVIEVNLAMMVFEDLHDTERALGLLTKSFNLTKEYEHWNDWNSQVASNISNLYAATSDWDNAYTYLRESVNWSKKLLNKQSMLSLIDNRPNAEDDNLAMVYVTICNFIESAFAASSIDADIQEDNLYLLDTENDEAVQNLTDWETLSPN